MATVTASPLLKVRPVPRLNWSQEPMVREPMASSGSSVLMKTVTRSPLLGFRPRAAWQSTRSHRHGDSTARVGGGVIGGRSRALGRGRGAREHAREHGSKAHLALGNLDAEELRHGDAADTRARICCDSGGWRRPAVNKKSALPRGKSKSRVTD